VTTLRQFTDLVRRVAPRLFADLEEYPEAQKETSHIQG